MLCPLQVLFTCLSHLSGQPRLSCFSGPLPAFFPSSPSLLITEVSGSLPLSLLQIHTDPGQRCWAPWPSECRIEEGSPLRSSSQYADTPGAEKGDQKGSHVIPARPSGDSFSDVHPGAQESLNCIPGRFKGQGSRCPQGTLREQGANSALGWSRLDRQDRWPKQQLSWLNQRVQGPGSTLGASEQPLPHSQVRAAGTQTGQGTSCREGSVGWKPLPTRAGALPAGPVRTACHAYLHSLQPGSPSQLVSR